MNSYFNTFLNLDESIEQLLKDEHNTIEIKQFALSLKDSVYPCLEELTQSAARLKKFVLVCSDKLYHAENVWLSKPKIAEAEKQEIWKQLGEISGHHYKIGILHIKCKNEAVTQANQLWEQICDRLKTAWFIDAKGNLKKGVGWNEKEGFVKALRHEFNYFSSQGLNQVINKSLNPVYQEITALNNEAIKSCISLFDNHTKTELNQKMNLKVNEIENKFQNPVSHIPSQSKGFKESTGSLLEALVNNSWGDISREEVVEFQKNVASKIDKFITTIFDDRVKLATQALEQAIAFYNDFLERQERYQQETPEQREAEKAWIDQQRHQLQQVQDGIEAILNAT